MRSHHFLVISILAFAFGLSNTAESAGAWSSLPLITKGKVDTNWVHIGYGGWTVDKGALQTKPDAKGIGLLVYQKERFGNCQIRLVYKTKDFRSQSGLYVRIGDGIPSQVNKPGASYERDAKSEPTTESTERVKASAQHEEGPWYAVHHGYEIQIASGDDQPGDTPFNGTGAVYSLSKSTGIVTDARNWVTMIVTLAGDRIFVDLDGRRVTAFDPDVDKPPAQEFWYEPRREPKRPQIGYIGLQTHDPTDIVWFKEVSVRPLPMGDVK